MTEGRPSIPVTVIGGYLGAGKTTLVNTLLRDPQGERLAIVVNDFGAIAIDAELIESSDGATVQLTNGCVCCSLSGGLLDVLTALRDGDPPIDRVVIEASGVADPVATAQYAHLPGFSLDAVVVLAAADSIRRQSRDRYVGRQVTRQLVDADVIVVTKTDLVPDRLGDLRSWLDDTAPGVPVVEAAHGDVPRAVLVDVTSSPRRTDRDVGVIDTAPHQTWSFATDRAVDIDVLSEEIDSLPDSVVRVKGVVTPTADTARRIVVHRVGRRTTWTDGPPTLAVGSRVVAIGLPGSDADPLVTTGLHRIAALIPSIDHEVHP